MKVSAEQLKREINQEATPAISGKKFRVKPVAEEAIIPPQKKSAIKEITKGNILGSGINIEKRKEMIEAKGFEPTEFAFERAIGRNDSLYSNFAELIGLTKRKVARIVLIQNNKKIGYATGFLVSPQLLLTNWHVFETKQLAAESELHFFYEYNNQGHPQTPVIFQFDTNLFFNNKELDYCFVGVQQKDVTNSVALSNIGYLYLDKSLGKIGDINVEKLNIIHHPQGDYKQISIRQNLFTGIDPTRIFYEADTAQGSSGSPVFNDQWQVVGLHHKSVAKMTEDEKDFLDKDNNIIPVIDGKIDNSRIVWLRNEGMRISVIVDHVLQQNPANAALAAINVPPPAETFDFTVNASSPVIKKNSVMSAENNITILVPVSALSNENSIDVSVFSKKINTAVPVKEKLQETEAGNDLLQEIAKVDKENAVDFSKCRGYSKTFLGTTISMPQPRKIMEKEIALLKNKTNELKYFKYSVIFNAAKKMPLLSAVNVEGDASKRLDNSTRSDDWLRDKRIDIECQLTDKFYASSGFDKGHMGRFEDANWDDTEADAFRNGIYTCFYTNACPQVPGINRRGSNLWGKLERAVLESGIKKEKGRQARMTVFNGPIFDADIDRVRLGVTVPMQFFKIICWLTDDNKLKATAFKLSQQTLVTDDQFHENLLLGDEALDIDQLVSYKHYQVRIKSLTASTHIDFSHLDKYDTFKGSAGSNEMLLKSEEGIKL